MNRESLFLLIFVALFAALNLIFLGTGRLVADWAGFGTILAAGLTLALYSFLYRDNPLFKLAEHLYVGVVAAYELAQVWYQNILTDVLNPLFRAAEDGGPRWIVLLPTMFGLFLFTRLIGWGTWLSRLSFAFIVGLGAGLAIPRRIASFVLQQIEPSIRPLWTDSIGWETLDTVVILVGVVSVLVYFSFSIEHTGVVGRVSTVGIWFLMISFGASFGYTVMARLSLLIGRVNFLLEDWLVLNPPLF